MYGATLQACAEGGAVVQGMLPAGSSAFTDRECGVHGL